jgi:hypothetical protein
VEAPEPVDHAIESPLGGLEHRAAAEPRKARGAHECDVGVCRGRDAPRLQLQGRFVLGSTARTFWSCCPVGVYVFTHGAPTP